MERLNQRFNTEGTEQGMRARRVRGGASRWIHLWRGLLRKSGGRATALYIGRGYALHLCRVAG